jgi:hypothetical protein
MNHPSHAGISATISVLSALVSISAIQPIVSLIASLIGILSGGFAIRYYYIKIKELKKGANS